MHRSVWLAAALILVPFFQSVAAETPASPWLPAAGAYWLTEDVTVTISAQDADLFWQTGDGERHPIVADQSLARVPKLDLELAPTGSDTALLATRYGESVVLPQAGQESTPSTDASVAELLDLLTPRLMLAWNVPGVSIAVIENHEIVSLRQFGIKTHGKSDKVTADTVFEAASMSKPFYAYAIMQLVQEGLLDLDVPLVHYLGRPYIDNDARHEKVTARMVLSHTAGFPNWRPGGRSGGGPLPMHFEPGTAMRYSGEGFWFLQTAVEELMGISTDQLTRQRLIEPLRMTRSSYVWKDEYAKLAAAGHTEEGHLRASRSLYRSANTAFTLYTTPEDYARYLLEMMNPDRSASHSVKADLLKEMLTRPSDLSNFALGWNVRPLPGGTRYSHSGTNRTGFRCYSEFDPSTGDGIVIMTNSTSGNHLWNGLMRLVREE